MGLPGATADRATFRWTTQNTYEKHDSSGSPWDFTSVPVVTTSHADVQVPVAWQFQPSRTTSGTNVVAEFEAPVVIVTVLDEDYEQIIGADLVMMGQNTYEIQYVAPPVGLFEVTVYQIYCRARDES